MDKNPLNIAATVAIVFIVLAALAGGETNGSMAVDDLRSNRGDSIIGPNGKSYEWTNPAK